MGFIGSYVWQLRQVWGTKMLLLPGAGAVLMDDAGRVLLGLRSDTHVWSHFGGTAEPGDDAETTMRREVLEEVGVLPTVYNAFAMTSRLATNRNVYPNGDELHHWSVSYLVTAWDGMLGQGDDEHSEMRFFSLDDLPAPLAVDTANLLEMLAEYRRTGEFQVQ